MGGLSRLSDKERHQDQGREPGTESAGQPRPVEGSVSDPHDGENRAHDAAAGDSGEREPGDREKAASQVVAHAPLDNGAQPNDREDRDLRHAHRNEPLPPLRFGFQAAKEGPEHVEGKKDPERRPREGLPRSDFAQEGGDTRHARSGIPAIATYLRTASTRGFTGPFGSIPMVFKMPAIQRSTVEMPAPLSSAIALLV